MKMTADSPNTKDCWNSVGVWSTSATRCERLDDVIHCRNCDVFIAAGRQIFERELPETYQQENLSTLAAIEDTRARDGVGVIVFRLGSELFALPSRVLELITQNKPIHRIPHIKSPYIKGVVNISGEVCLCHSLIAVLDVVTNRGVTEENSQHVYARIVIIRIDDTRYVFPVDEVVCITQLQIEKLRSPPATISDEIKQLVSGSTQLNGHEVAVLDVDNLHRLLERR